MARTSLHKVRACGLKVKVPGFRFMTKMSEPMWANKNRVVLRLRLLMPTFQHALRANSFNQAGSRLFRCGSQCNGAEKRRTYLCSFTKVWYQSKLEASGACGCARGRRPGRASVCVCVGLRVHMCVYVCMCLCLLSRREPSSDHSMLLNRQNRGVWNSKLFT